MKSDTAAVTAPPRAYRMSRRADSVAATRETIIRATMETAREARSLSVGLGPVSERAGVSVQTILRHFGSRDGLLDAAMRAGLTEVRAERRPTGPDPQSAVAALVAHYERLGDLVVGVLAEEDDDLRAREMCTLGRAEHRAWVTEVFAADLARRVGADRDALLDLLVVATDVYAWKLLRRDRGLSVHRVCDRILQLTGALTDH